MKRFVVLLLCLSGVSLYAQNGRWVEHTLDNFASGSPMYARGDGCLGYTENNADRLLIFDIDVHEWEEVVLEKAQAFEALTTEGQVVFAYSDSLLFGYSAVSQTWDTITYTGDFMSGSEHQYECGDYLAYLATADYLYVFDAAIGYWQYYDHGFSGEFTFAVFWVKDDYMAMAMARNSPGQPKNVVYSAHTHTFNEITDGIGRPSPQTDHGFAGMFNIDYNNTDYRLIGYSALSNTFDVVNYSCGDNESSVGGTGSGAMAADEFTVYTQTFRYVVPHESVTANFYGFDTRRGAWDHSVVNFDWTVDRYYGGWYQCGQFSFDKSLFTADDSYHIFIYSGIDGQFRDFTPGLIYKSTTSAFRGGGTIFGVFDTLNAWGYDVAGDRGSLQALALDKTANFEQGDDYLTLTRWSTTSDDMITYFYNGNTNRWTSVTVPDNHTTDGIKTEHIYLHRGYPEQEIIFYSAIKDTIIKVDFADGTYAGSRVRGVLGFTTSEARSVLFDGLNGASYEADFEFDRFGLGMQSGVFCDTSDDTWYGYSTLFGNLTPLATSEEPYYVLDTGYIGLVTVSYPEKVYTFNGLGDSWVELAPEGGYVSALLGKKTIILIRDDRVYAFDPEGDPTGVDDYPGPQPARFELSQNYPNPFNPVTTIAYSMDRQGDVAITIYNLLGQKVKKLVDENKTAGEYQVVWDGTNDDGRAVASGVYFYRIKAGEEVEARKMLLLK